jgi:hypothetical protein
MNESMRISARRLAALLVVSVAWTSPSHADATQLNRKTEFSQESYLLKQALYASSKAEELGDPLGDLWVCALLTTGRSGRDIEVRVSMPDSGQILTIRAPIKQLRNGSMVFDFADDGWGNSGHGKLKKIGNKAELNIEQTGSQPDANKNVRRNYGSYFLSKGACNE